VKKRRIETCSSHDFIVMGRFERKIRLEKKTLASVGFTMARSLGGGGVVLQHQCTSTAVQQETEILCPEL